MNVLMTADTLGGVWTYALDLCGALSARGVTVTLATLGAPPRGEQRRAAERIPGLRLEESGFKLEWMENPWEDVDKAGEWLRGLARETSPDIIHLNTFPHGRLPWGRPVLMVGHSCVLSWWEAVNGEPAPPAWGTYRERVASGLRAADLVVAPSRAMLSSLERHYGPLRSSRVIPNGRDPGAFRPALKEPFVLTAGRLWDEAKNLALLEAAAPRLNWPVYVAGDAEHPDGGVREPRHVRLLGRLSDEELAAWFGRAALYALPARYEPFGLSALEAAHAGCALVLADIPSLREVWGEEAAVYVPPDDAEALAEALSALMEDAPLREALAARAAARARTYTVEAMVRAYLEAYTQMLSVSRPAPLTGRY